MLYCPMCKHLTAQGDCCFCDRKERKLRAPEADDPVFLTSADYLNATIVEQALKDAELPFLREGQLGGAISAYMGSYRDIFSFFVPFSLYGQALSCLDQAVGDQPGFRDHLDAVAAEYLSSKE